MRRRYTVIEAAKVLGVGTDAVRKRVARGTVEHEKVDDTVYVWLDNGHDDGTTGRRDNGTTEGYGANTELLDAYRDQLDEYKDQVGYLRSQLDQERRANDENRRLLAALIQRVPELEAGQEAPGSSQRDASPGPTDANTPAGGAAHAASGGTEAQGSPGVEERRSWWRRMFGE